MIIHLAEYLENGSGEHRISTGVNINKIDDTLEELSKLLFPYDPRIQKGIAKQLKIREEKGSTGIGRGYAIPHMKTSLVDKIETAILTPNKKIDYNSMDGKPVYFVIGIVAPPIEMNRGSYLDLIGRTATMIKNGVFNEFVEMVKNGQVIDSNRILEKILRYENP